MREAAACCKKAQQMQLLKIRERNPGHCVFFIFKGRRHFSPECLHLETDV